MERASAGASGGSCGESGRAEQWADGAEWAVAGKADSGGGERAGSGERGGSAGGARDGNAAR